MLTTRKSVSSRCLLLASVLCSVSLVYFSYLGGISSVESPLLQWDLTKHTNDTDIFDLSKVEILSWRPRILLYRNFISEKDANYIVELGKNLVQRSQVVGEAGKSQVHEARTSSGVFFVGDLAQDPIVKKYAEKIAEWTQLPAQNGEAFYLLKYEIGQQYKPHMDYFRSDEAGIAKLGNKSDRIATVITYLGTPDEGGETFFPSAGLEVPAIQGNAVLFWDQTTDFKGDPKTLHGSRPVVSGTKWCMTKWIRSSHFK